MQDAVARNLARHYARLWRATKEVLAEPAYGVTNPQLVTMAMTNPHAGIDGPSPRIVPDQRMLVKFYNQLLLESVLVKGNGVVIAANVYAYKSGTEELAKIKEGLSFISAITHHLWPIWITETGAGTEATKNGSYLTDSASAIRAAGVFRSSRSPASTNDSKASFVQPRFSK